MGEGRGVELDEGQGWIFCNFSRNAGGAAAVPKARGGASF